MRLILTGCIDWLILVWETSSSVWRSAALIVSVVAIIKGVRPVRSLALMSAPLATSNLTTYKIENTDYLGVDYALHILKTKIKIFYLYGESHWFCIGTFFTEATQGMEIFSFIHTN